ncbi:Uncharacterised protein [Cedecea neteri]|uniref:Uncharacterized protein n=1 Tax=Cedecea neteri TaxID=158822 RepID=A0A2X2V7N0_9ENTR|nr:Uncharacterised protein [Cedecea neteri]
MFNKLTLSALIAPLSLSVVFACQAEAAGFDVNQIKQINAGVLNVGYVDLGPKRRAAGLFCCTAGPTTSTALIRLRLNWRKQGYRVIVPNLRGFGSTRFLFRCHAPQW